MRIPNPLAALTAATEDESAHPDWPAGWSDPTNPLAYVPPADRAYWPTEEGVDNRILRELISTGGIVGRTVTHHGRPYMDTANVEQDAALAIHVRKTSIAAANRAGAEALRSQQQYDAHNYRCAACGIIEPLQSHTVGVTDRPLPAGLGSCHYCASCYAVACTQALEQLAAQTVNGKSRAELVRANLNLSKVSTP